MRYTMRLASPSEWAELLNLSEGDYSLSQTYEFGDALAQAYNEYLYEPRIFQFDDGLTLLLPLVKVISRLKVLRCFQAMPFSLNGAPVWVGGNLTSEHLMMAIESLRADSFHLNSGGFADLSAAVRGGLGGLESIASFTHVLELASGFDEMWTSRFTGKVRNQCRVAERKRVKVYTASTVDDFEAYYSIYVASTLRWGHRTPPYPLALFRALAQLTGKGVELKLANVNDRAVAGVLLFHGRRTTLYWSGAMLKEYGGYCPNNALLRAAIADACQHGVLRFDFGSSGELDSVRKFKESFGAVPCFYHDFVSTTPKYRLAKAARRGLALAGV